jgi:hypothetical protein
MTPHHVTATRTAPDHTIQDHIPFHHTTPIHNAPKHTTLHDNSPHHITTCDTITQHVTPHHNTLCHSISQRTSGHLIPPHYITPPHATSCMTARPHIPLHHIRFQTAVVFMPRVSYMLSRHQPVSAPGRRPQRSQRCTPSRAPRHCMPHLRRININVKFDDDGAGIAQYSDDALQHNTVPMAHSYGMYP